jgi:hypothetical protein
VCPIFAPFSSAAPRFTARTCAALTSKGKNPNGYDLPPQAMALGVPLVRLQGSFEAATVGH